MRTLLPVWFPMLVARFEKSVVSAGVNTRRKARRPNAFSAWVKQAVSVVDLGMHDRIEVARVASANAYAVALPMIVAYPPTPAGEIETAEPPTVANPPISVSASTGASGTPLPSKSRMLFANSHTVSFWSDAVETGAEGRSRRPAGPVDPPPVPVPVPVTVTVPEPPVVPAPVPVAVVAPVPAPDPPPAAPPGSPLDAPSPMDPVQAAPDRKDRTRAATPLFERVPMTPMAGAPTF